jgi:hypothetical protein
LESGGTERRNVVIEPFGILAKLYFQPRRYLANKTSLSAPVTSERSHSLAALNLTSNQE